MKRMMMTALCATLIAGGANAADLPGYDRLDIPAAHRGALIAGSIWYPAGSRTYPGLIGDNPVFHGTQAMVGAGLAEGQRPLVVISHGSGGNMDGLGWLAEGLVARGAMVLGLNHPGSTSGDSSPRRSVLLHDRAADIRAALDAALADPTFGPHVDPARISILGFSLGGATALNIAGARMDRTAYTAYCDSYPEAQDCAFLAKGGVDLTTLPPEWESDMRDPRIGAVIGVDPAFGFGMTDESLRAIDMPTLLLSLGQPLLAVDPQASGLLANLPRAQQITLPDTDHFGFLGLCKPDGPALLRDEGEDPICDQAPGFDRAATHAQAVDAIADFLAL
ncbi:alpha/beta hydrolase family protein [Paracoccus sp. p4-l81]|uniref:alpha/beta hydrolase family protein n=1 Tax=Paracoccus sp. p4-l81 TaxID=3342806 RepID=UPI0035B88AB4